MSQPDGGNPAPPDCPHCKLPMTFYKSQLEKRDGKPVMVSYFQCNQCSRVNDVVLR